MHAKETVCDNIVFVGSFTISSPGERNAENGWRFETRRLPTE
jgi:hypothetical protein